MILAGPKQVTIYDPSLLTLSDLSKNFYANEDQIGKVTRAEASLPHLKELNPSVLVDVVTDVNIENMYAFFKSVSPITHALLSLTTMTKNSLSSSIMPVGQIM